MQTKEAIIKINENIRFNNLKASIVESTSNNDSHSEIENLTSKNNLKTFKIKNNDAGPVLAHSAFDPEKEAEKVIANLDFSRHTFIIVFGLGMGYHIEKILEQATEQSRILIIEPDKNVYQNCMKNKDMTKILGDSRVLLFIGINADNMLTVLSGFALPYFSNLGHNVQYVALKYYSLFYNDMSEIIGKVSKALQLYWKSLGNCHTDHNIGVIQTILNIEDLIDNIGIARLKDSYKERPVIIVSSGPSLNKNIHHLKKAKGKALIIAVDSALDRLLENNIIPDVVATLERITIADLVFGKMKNPIPKSVVLVAPMLTEVGTVNLFKENNKVFFFQQGVGTQEHFGDILKTGILWGGLSAALVALSFAQYIGANKIALTGQDLAYGENGDVYVKGVSNIIDEKEKKLRLTDDYLVTVKDYEGKNIPSNVLWRDQLLTFNNLIMKYSKSVEFFDATEGGARKEGATIITLENFISEHCTCDIEDINGVINREKNVTDKARKKEIIKNFVDRTKKDYEYFKSVHIKLQNKLSRLEPLYKEYIEKTNDIPEEKVDEIIKDIVDTDTIIKEIKENKFLNLYYQGLIMAFTTEIQGLNEEDFIKRLEKNIQIQYVYILLITDVFSINLDCFSYGIEYLESKLKGTAMTNDIKEILKKVMKNNNINPGYVDDYYKSILDGPEVAQTKSEK